MELDRRQTLWDGVKEAMKSFDLSREDAQIWKSGEERSNQ